jgi:hypothetical protein
MTLPLPAYIAAVEAITPLPDSAICWAMESCHGGIAPEDFAYWISLTASPSVVSPPLLPHDGRSKSPRQVHESLTGEQFEKERA